METFVLGIYLLLGATGLFFLVQFLARWIAQTRETSRPALPVPPIADIHHTQDAVLLVQRGGGRVLYANQPARDWFGYQQGTPNLERLARRAQPSEVFLSLCAIEGQARLTIDGRLVEGSSYYVPHFSRNGNTQDSPMGSILVTLHRLQVTAIGSQQSPSVGKALQLFADLSRTITSSLEMDQTLAAILESVSGLIPADFSEITLWDPHNQRLVPYRMVGADEAERRLEPAAERYAPEAGYSGWLVRQHQPLMIPQVDVFTEVRPAVDRRQFPFHSYLGVPLEVEGEPVGTLELASLKENAFTENDLEVLLIISGEAAIALKNAVTHHEKQKRVRELSGLVQLVQNVSSLRESPDFYQHLVEGISQLLDVRTLGLLIYHESSRRLDAQLPFQGIPAPILDLYHLSVPPGSPAEQVWLSQEIIVTDDASSDPRLEALGMSHMAKAAGIQRTVVLPLASVGGPLGYLQVGDKLNGQSFDDEDLRLLRTIASQVSAIIENAILIRESRERAQRAEALRRVASLTGSAATLTEILAFSLRELSRLLRADIGSICLLDESIGELRLERELLFGFPASLDGHLGRIGIADHAYRFTVTASQKPWLSGDPDADEQSLSLYQAVINTLGIQSVMLVPLSVRGQGIGELMLGCTQPAHFDRSDLTLVSTTASQLASAIEKASLYGQTDESLQRRVLQLQALMRISRELNATLDWEHLIKLIYDEALRTTQADFGTLILFDWEETGEATRKVAYSIGNFVSQTLTSLDNEVLAAGEARIIVDYQVHIEHSDQALFAPLSGIRSSVIAPISYQGHMVGLIQLHSRSVDQFDATSLEIVQSLMVQAAIALGNAHRYQQLFQRTDLLNRRVETMTALLQTSQNLQLETPIADQLEAIAYAIQETTQFNSILISVFDPESQCMVRTVGVGVPLEALAELKEHTPTWAMLQETFRPEFQLSRSYYIPFEQVPFVFPPELHSVVLTRLDAERTRVGNAWHPEDTLAIPLLTMDGQPLGLISVDNPRDGLRPDRPMIETLELFASQAALALETHNRLGRQSRRIAELQAELARQQVEAEAELARLPLLQNKSLEQTTTIDCLNARTRRIRACLDIAEAVMQQTRREDVLSAVAQRLLNELGFEAVITAEPSEGGLRVVHALGSRTAEINPQVLLGQRNPLWSVYQSGKPLLVSNLEAQETWQHAPLLTALEAQAFLALPVMDRQEDHAGPSLVSAVMLATSRLPIANLEEELPVFEITSYQVGAALRNLQLFEETSQRLRELNLLLDFSRELGTLDTESILRTLVESALKVVPAASGAMVATWVPHRWVLEPRFAAGYADNEKIMQIRYHAGEALPGRVFETGEALRLEDVDFLREYPLQPDQLALYRDATLGLLPISTLAVPVMTQDSRLGVLVLDNFRASAAFTTVDQDLVASLARQTALTLENARLYQASEERTAQLQALTRVAGTLTSSLQTGELIGTLLDQLATVVPYETGTLWLRQGNMLTVRSARGYEDSERREGLVVEVEDSLLLREMISTGQPLSVGDVRQDPRFPVLAEQPYLSWLAVPLLSKGEVQGLLVLEKTEANYYSPAHIQALVTFAGQAAVALENARLYEESLRRAGELDQRSTRLALLNRLSTALSSSLDLASILDLTLQELKRAVSCSVVSVVMFDSFGKPFLQAESPARSDEILQTLPDNPIFERLQESLGIFITEDISLEAELLPLSRFFLARSTRALMILPLAAGITLNGLVLVQNDAPERFSDDEVELARTVTNQAAVAVQNARLFVETERLFAETERRSAELATLFDFGMSITQELDQERLFDITFENLSRLIPCDSVMIVLVEGETDLVVHRVDFGERKPAFTIRRTDNSFSEYVMETNLPLLIPDALDPARKVAGAAGGIICRSWLGVPILARGIPCGVISVQSETPEVFGDAQLRMLSQIANHFSVALDNASLFATVQNYATDQAYVVKERTEQLANEHKRIQTLLSIITELSASLDLDLVLTRTLSVVKDTISAAHSVILLLQPDGKSLFIRASQGYDFKIPRGGQVSSLGADEGLAGWVIRNREPALVHDLSVDDRWVSRDDYVSRHRSALTVPLLAGEEILGVMMFYHPEVAHFDEDSLILIQAVAKQIAIAVNNAQLYNLIRDQAERLGDMLRTQHIETSRSQAILEAVADGVLVTDARGRITLFNASAEQILGLKRERVLGSSLENFFGLFGNAAQDWAQTIRKWSEDPDQYKPGDIYSERIELDNQRVVAIHLSPVRLRHDFLGTVSIFRDITHEVEVDRLKSEFVATVSHELRTPMTSIKGYVDLLLMGATGSFTEQQRQFLQVVKQNTERLAILVNDLLDVSRIEAGKVTLSLQALDLRELIDSVLASMARRIEDEDRPITLESSFQPSLPLVTGDRERVMQILDNLVANAYQYTPIHGKINVSARQVGDSVQVDVEDNGIGIKPEERDRIFERFYRGENALVMQTSGNGLGLPIVQKLVELHNGKIWFESKGVRGQGSTFSFTLPLHHSG